MNILVVDDDVMIRNLFSLLVRQIEYFSGNVFSVSSADEAEQVCEKEDVDLVITDITMPKRSGLDLIQSLRVKHPDIQIACLSAYDDYDYIRRALQLGVLDYILKPELKLEDIVSLFSKVESFAPNAEKALLGKGDLQDLNDVNSLMEDYMDDGSRTEEICALLDCDARNSIIVSAFQLRRYEISMDSLLKAQHIAVKTLQSGQKSGLAYIHERERIVILLKDTFDSIESRENEMMKLSLLYERNLSEISGQKIVLSLYEMAPNISGLNEAVTRTMDILDAYEYYPGYDRNRIELTSLNENETRTLRQLAGEINSTADLQRSAETFLETVKTWHQDHMIPRNVKSAAVCGLFYLMEGGKIRDPESLLEYNRYARKIRYAHNCEECMQIVMDGLEKLIHKSSPTHMIRNSSIQAAVDYINEHYSEKITLDDVSRHIYLNRTYASQLFKKHMNVNFADYLEIVRINKAKEFLLDTSMQIAEIALKVGYSNQSYFTKVFKRNTGMSPNSFRLMSKK